MNEKKKKENENRNQTDVSHTVFKKKTRGFPYIYGIGPRLSSVDFAMILAKCDLLLLRQ